jgi:hypothetical protein
LLLLRRGPYARAFENLILALIVLSVVSIGVEAIPGLPDWAMRAMRVEEIIVVAVFSLEYLLRIVAAREKLAFIFSFYGLVDLLAIAPFFLAGFDARWLRVLRMLRLLRVLKLPSAPANSPTRMPRSSRRRRRSKPNSTSQGRCRARSCRRHSLRSRGAMARRE